MREPHYPESSTCHYIIIMQKALLIPAKLICNSNPLIQRADLAMGMLQYGKSHLKRKVRRISRAYGSLLNVPIFLHFFLKHSTAFYMWNFKTIGWMTRVLWSIETWGIWVYDMFLLSYIVWQQFPYYFLMEVYFISSAKVPSIPSYSLRICLLCWYLSPCKLQLRYPGIWAPSQYKDRLIYVWRFPC